MGPTPIATAPTGTTVNDVVRAHERIAAAAHEGAKLETVLRLIAEGLCDLAAASRALVFVEHSASATLQCLTNLVDGRVLAPTAALSAAANRPARRLLDAGSPTVVADTTSLATGDRLTHPRLGRARSYVAIPLTFRGRTIGLAFLDETAPRVVDDAVVERLASFAGLATATLCIADSLRRSRSDHRLAQRNTEMLTAVVRGWERLDESMAAGASVVELVACLADLLAKPVLVIDPGGRERASALPPGTSPRANAAVVDLAQRLRQGSAAFPPVKPGDVAVVGPDPVNGLAGRYLVAPITIGRDHWGDLIVPDLGTPFGTADRHLVKKTTTLLVSHLRSGRAAGSLDEIHSSLALDLLRGGVDPQSLADRAAAAGMEMDGKHVVCLLSTVDGVGNSQRSDALAAMLREAFDRSAFRCAAVPEGLAAIITLPRGTAVSVAMRQLRVTLENLLAGHADLAPLASISAPIDGLQRSSTAFIDAKQVLRCRLRFVNSGMPDVLSVSDFGVGSAFVASSDMADIDSFARVTLGALVDVDGSDELLRTLHVFLASSRNVRRCSQLLGIHENTVRYRLSRIEKITGLRILLDSADQMRAELALLVLRLQGICPWNLAARADRSENVIQAIAS